MKALYSFCTDKSTVKRNLFTTGLSTVQALALFSLMLIAIINNWPGQIAKPDMTFVSSNDVILQEAYQFKWLTPDNFEKLLNPFKELEKNVTAPLLLVENKSQKNFYIGVIIISIFLAGSLPLIELLSSFFIKKKLKSHFA